MKAGSRESSSPQARWVRRLGWAAAAFAAYLILAGVVFPRVLRSQLTQRVAAATGTRVTLDEVRFHPLAWRLGLRGFSMADPAGHVLLAWSNVVVDAQVSSLWRGEAHAREVRVERPRVQLRREGGGQVPWLEVLARLSKGSGDPADPAPSAASRDGAALALRGVHVDALVVMGGEVDLEDRVPAEPFRVSLSPVELSAEHFATRPGVESPLVLSARGDGGEVVEWSGHLGLSPLSVKGTLVADRLAVARPRPYTDAHSTKRPTRGTLSLRVPHEVEWNGAGLRARVRDATVALNDLGVVEKDNDAPFLELAGLRVDGWEVDWPERRVAWGGIRMESPKLHARRIPGKTPEQTVMNWRQLIDPQTVAEWVRFSAGWHLHLKELACDGGAVLFEDRTLEPPLRLAVDGARLRVNGLANLPDSPPAQIEAGLRWNGLGTARLQGTVGVHPVEVAVRAEWRDLGVAVLSPYLSHQIRLILQRGSTSGDLDVRYGASLRARNGSLVEAEGRVVLDDFAALEAGSGADFIRWKQIEMAGLSASLDPHRARVTNLVARGLQTSLVVTTNGQVNVLELIREARELAESADAPEPEGATATTLATATTAVAAPGVSAAPAPATARAAAFPSEDEWQVQVDRAALESVALFATDQFYGGGFHTTVESLDGEFRDLRWPQPGPVQVALQGRLSAVSGFSLEGWLKPDPDDFGADLKLNTRRADLTQFAPYTIRFVGYPVKKGELTAEVRYRVAGDVLTADNKLLLDQFTLGPRTPSPDAIQLPVKLGVALLKDHEGRIQLDLPLTGTLSDPQFRLAPLIWQAVRNVVLKAAAAPFRLLGALLGGGEADELEFVEFEAGTTQLAAHQERRLHSLLKALAARPALELGIVPGFDPRDDAAALARQRLEQRLKALQAESLAALAADPAAASPTVPATLSPEERGRFLRVAYVREFGTSPGPEPTAAPAAPDVALPATAAPPAARDAATEAVAAAALTLSDAELEQRLMGLNPVPPAELAALAEARREVVRTRLLDGGLAPERLVPAAAEGSEEVRNEKARVLFRLE